ncbi:ABC transporter substrate-binding protein [Clostridium sp. PL3]|uniref:ABC transporter substrate-binding protein n=1 Tax=Clostridium thailandense TaxID=2794346 RepID=A0A949U261_9CLOT|nr:ABC transporter substrate-binding protein [Clostridium thailandense]MBV7276016.1 ABC transporter substrate-binding protein [Clostridium thailandense]
MIRKKKSRITFLLILSMIICSVFFNLTGCEKKVEAPKAATQTITDDAGRKVTIPEKINKCYYTSPIGMIMVYSLAPDKMAGWSMKLTDNEKKYIPSKYTSLPFLGGLQMNGKINVEELAKVKPDVIFSVGPDAIDKTSVSTADKLQQQLNIPVIVVDSNIEKIDKAYALMGKILGAEDKAKELADYCNNTVNEVKAATKDIPKEKRVNVYYAEGPKGLATEAPGSSHALVLDMAKGNNVAKVQSKGGSGMSEVSMEQVLSWNPDVIISWGTDAGGACDLIKTSQDWKNINAVKNGKIYEIPNSPFNWFDRPPSVNRYLGLKWLATTLYPDSYKVDMVKEVKSFYSLFYHADISDDDAKALLKNSVK